MPPLSTEEPHPTHSQEHGPVGRTTAKAIEGLSSLLMTATHTVFHMTSFSRFYKEQ